MTFNFSCAIMVLLLADRNANEEAQDVQWMCIVVQWLCTPLTFVFSLFLGQPSFLIVMIVAAHLAVITYLMRQVPFLRKMKKFLDFGLSDDITDGAPDSGRNEDVHTSLLQERGVRPGQLCLGPCCTDPSLHLLPVPLQSEPSFPCFISSAPLLYYLLLLLDVVKASKPLHQTISTFRRDHPCISATD